MKLIIDIPEDNIRVEYGEVRAIRSDKDILCNYIFHGTPLTESDDCVSRAELLKALDTWDKFGVDDTGHLFRLDNLSYPHYEPYIHYRDVIKAVKGMPSIQPKRDKGEWKRCNFGYECTKCGYHWLEDTWYNFCPNCGADMRKRG